jgi:guanylate kinase
VINNNLEDCYNKILNLIQAEIKNTSKDYDKDFIRNHVEKITS